MQAQAKAVCVMVFAALTGCAASGGKADTDKFQAVQGVHLTTATYARADFFAMTADKVAGSALVSPLGGTIVMYVAGNKVIEENQIADPAEAIAAALSAPAQARLQPTSTGAIGGRKPANDHPKQVAHAAGGKGVVLEVKTLEWGYGYFPLDWTRYQVIYKVRARVIDAATSKVIAQTRCENTPDDPATAPTHDELLVNQAALLKAKLATVATVCASTIKQELFVP